MSIFCQRHRAEGYRPQYAADFRPHRTRIQPTQRRRGAFWEDRYQATAIESDEHLHRCRAYIDLNMVRAGVIDHPIKWVNSGYQEIQQLPKRYRVIDLPGLFGLCGFSKLADFQQADRQWVEITLRDELSVRDARWSEAVAVGSLAFVEKVKSELGFKAHRQVIFRFER
jgi:putative transposase